MVKKRIFIDLSHEDLEEEISGLQDLIGEDVLSTEELKAAQTKLTKLLIEQKQRKKNADDSVIINLESDLLLESNELSVQPNRKKDIDQLLENEPLRSDNVRDHISEPKKLSMKWVIIFCTAVSFFMLLVVTNGLTVTPCQKIERQILVEVKINKENPWITLGIEGLKLASGLYGANLGDGKLMRITALNEFPNLPPQIGCSILFYQWWVNK